MKHLVTYIYHYISSYLSVTMEHYLTLSVVQLFYIAGMPASDYLFSEKWDQHFQLFKKSSLLQLSAESVKASWNVAEEEIPLLHERKTRQIQSFVERCILKCIFLFNINYSDMYLFYKFVKMYVSVWISEANTSEFLDNTE